MVITFDGIIEHTKKQRDINKATHIFAYKAISKRF